MRVAAILTMLAVPLSLLACDSGEEVMDAEDMPMAENMPAGNMSMSDDMPMMADAEMRMANAEGTVTAIDEGAGTITIEHGPVAAVDWPAMTMAFDAEEDLRQEVTVGDEVIFEFRMSDSGNELTSINRK